MEACGGAVPILEPAPAFGATAGFNDSGADPRLDVIAHEELSDLPDHESFYCHDSAAAIPFEHACDYFELDSWTVADALSSDQYVNNESLSGYNSLFPETQHESYWERADESGLFMETTVECFPPKFDLMECQDDWTLMAEEQSTLHLVLNITDRSNSMILQGREPVADLMQMQIPLLELQDVADDISCHHSQVSLSNEIPLFFHDHALIADVAVQENQRAREYKTEPTMLDFRRDESYAYDYALEQADDVALPNHELLSFGDENREVLQDDCLQQLIGQRTGICPDPASIIDQTSPDAFNSEEDETEENAVLRKEMFVDSVIESVIDSCCLSNSSSDSSGYTSTFKPYNAGDEHPKAHPVSARHAETNDIDACSLAFTEHKLEKEDTGSLELLVNSCLSNSSNNVTFSSSSGGDEHPRMCLARARHTIKKRRQNRSRVPRKKIRLVQTGEPSEECHSESRKPLMPRNSRKQKLVAKKSTAGFKGTLLPAEPVKILQSWLSGNIGNPYPTPSEKEALIDETGLSMRQVQNWLSNARYRLGIQRKHNSYSSSF